MDTSPERRRGRGRRRRDPGLRAVPAPPDVSAGEPPPEEPTHRRATLAALSVVAAASAAALVAGLLDWVPGSNAPARALTGAESERLAATRVTNYRAVRAGVRLVVGTGGSRTHLVGWVDWARPLAYLDVRGPGAGPHRGLVQATPSVVMVRPDS
ncbi:hypothetical protein E1193_28020, partial [Micromonospora sp. KC606]